MKCAIAAAFVIGYAYAASPCAPLSPNTAPRPSPNTLSGFQSYSTYADLAHNVTTPTGYERVMIKENATITSTKYMYYVDLGSYSPQTCAKFCDASPGCDSFNVYFQRNPSIEPAVACPNPTANILARCALYSEPVNALQATNFGQNLGFSDTIGQAFRIAIRGSNAYNKVSGSIGKTVTVTVATTTVTVSAGADIKAFLSPFTNPGNLMSVPVRVDVTSLVNSLLAMTNTQSGGGSTATTTIPVPNTTELSPLSKFLTITTTIPAPRAARSASVHSN